jgi:hypothetical protein
MSYRERKKREKLERLEKANKLIQVISSCGRKFFRHKTSISYFELNKFNHLYFIDKWRGYKLPCWRSRNNWRYQSHAWCNFSEGGTLKDLIKDLSTYIIIGEDLPNHFHPLPQWYSQEENYWGYPKEDMDKVRKFYKENF